MIYMEEMRVKKIYNEDYTPNFLELHIRRLKDLCGKEIVRECNLEIRDIRLQMRNIRKFVRASKDSTVLKLITKVAKQGIGSDKAYTKLSSMIKVTYPKAKEVYGDEKICFINYCKASLDTNKIFDYYDIETTLVDRALSLNKVKELIVDLQDLIDEGDSLDYVLDTLETKISFLDEEDVFYAECKEILIDAISDYESTSWIGKVA